MEAVDRLLARANRDPDALAVLPYGSRARGNAGPRRDTAVCVVLRDGSPRDRLPAKTGDHLGSDLDVGPFQALPLAVRRRVLREGRIRWARDEDALYDLATRTGRAWEDSRRVHHVAAVSRGP